MHVTLVNPPYRSGATHHPPFIPLGISYLAAVLDKNQYDVDVIDCQAQQLSYEDFKSEIGKRKPDIVGITAVTSTYKSALHIAEIAKEVCPNSLTILGGCHATFWDDKVLQECPYLDIVVRGEGEQTILELAALVSKSNLKKLDQVAGITFRKNGQIVRTPDRPFIQDLDELPYPAYNFFALSKYRIFGLLILPITSSRGCIFNCTFCLANRMAGKSFRTRSAKNIVGELEELRDAYKPDAFTFEDETFTSDKKRALEICQEIKDRNIGLPWSCSTRVDRVSKELLVKMREANCQMVSFGVESGSQKMLDAMKKGTTVKQNEKAIKLAKEVGISVTISVIVGYPGETIDSLKQTFDFIRRTKPDDVLISLATPYPGIEMTNIMKEMGVKVCDDWSQFDYMTPLFTNPSLAVDLNMMRKKFYNSFHSPSYVLRQYLRGTLFSQMMARAALSQLLWRLKTPTLIAANFRRALPLMRNFKS